MLPSRDAELHSTQLVALAAFLTYPTSVLLITECWHCYSTGSVNILCEMLISWGNVWLTDRRSLIKRLIGGDLGWASEDMSYGQRWTLWTFYIVQCFTIALHDCCYIRFYTLCDYDVSFKCRRRHLSLRDITDVGYMYACCVSQGFLIPFCSKFTGLHDCQKLSK